MIGWELVIGTLAGFVTAFFAEPIKSYIQERAARRNLKRVLYRELGDLYLRWNEVLAAAQRLGPEYIESNISIATRTDCYQYAKGRPVLFYSLDDALAINTVYSNFLLVGSGKLRLPAEKIQFAKASLQVFESLLAKDELDKKYLLGVLSTEKRARLQKCLRDSSATEELR